MIILSTFSLGIWIYLLLGRGGFWRVRESEIHNTDSTQARASVVAIVPARNEAAVIGRAVQSLLQQQLDPKLQLIVVDDASEDGTSAAAFSAASEICESERLTVLKGEPLTAGWTGKLWALSQGVEHALTLHPDYLLFTDADIVHGQVSVKDLVSCAQSNGCDLASLMVKLACESFAEKALIPAFVFFFSQLYPPAWTISHGRKTAGAAGGCLLIRPEALARIGGLAAIGHAVIDDCTLAKAVKRSGGHIWMGLTARAYSVRSYGTFSEIMNHSALLLIGTVTAMAITYVLSVVALLTGKPLLMAVGGGAWILMAASYSPVVRFYKQSPLWSIALPAIAVFYTGATITSAIRYWTGKGGKWKGRLQDVRL